MALPELLQLFKTIEAKAKEVSVNKKVSEDVKKVDDAFKNKDAEELRKIFNSQ